MVRINFYDNPKIVGIAKPGLIIEAEPRYVPSQSIMNLRLEIENRIARMDELIKRIKPNYESENFPNSD